MFIFFFTSHCVFSPLFSDATLQAVWEKSRKPSLIYCFTLQSNQLRLKQQWGLGGGRSLSENRKCSEDFIVDRVRSCDLRKSQLTVLANTFLVKGLKPLLIMKEKKHRKKKKIDQMENSISKDEMKREVLI